jgi:hypothetical protein
MSSRPRLSPDIKTNGKEDSYRTQERNSKIKLASSRRRGILTTLWEGIVVLVISEHVEKELSILLTLQRFLVVVVVAASGVPDGSSVGSFCSTW